MYLTLDRLLKSFDDAGLIQSLHNLPSNKQAPLRYGVDSRKLSPGDWFIAYRGEQVDSHRFLKAELLQNLGGVVYEDEAFTEVLREHGLPAIRVSDGRMAWAYAASSNYQDLHQDLILIGVTGTNGKTSTTWTIKEMLAALGEPCLAIGTLGALFPDKTIDIGHTTPDPEQLFRLLKQAKDEGIRFVVMEVSSHAIAQSRLGPLRFQAAVFTSFSRDHLDFHSSMQDYFAAKWQFLTDYLKPNPVIAIAHHVLEAKQQYFPAVELPPHTQVYGEQSQVKVAASGWPQVCYSLRNRDLDHARIDVRAGEALRSGALSTITEHGMENFLAALIVVEALLNKPFDTGLWSQIKAVPGRLEPVTDGQPGKPKVFVDYAHTPDAIERTLTTIRPLVQGRLWIVFGCGGERDPGKRPLMARAAETYADAVVVTSDNPRRENPTAIIEQILTGFDCQKKLEHVEADRRLAIRWCIRQATEQDVILIAGKGHETYQLIGERVEEFDDRIVARLELQSLALQ